tara:strand:+ start:450 stop:620 length:171 start_codon:yes stop_codon:yes gene_type:complete
MKKLEYIILSLCSHLVSRGGHQEVCLSYPTVEGEGFTLKGIKGLRMIMDITNTKEV